MRGRHPEPHGLRLRSARNELAEAAVEHQHLSERRQPDRGRRQDHRGRCVERQAREPGRAHQYGEQQLPHDVGRHDAERDPVVGAGDAVLHVGQRIGRQRDAGDVERDHRVLIEIRLDQPDQAGAEQRDRDRDADREPAAVDDEAAEQVDQSALAIFRNEALGGSGETEVERLADQQHPGPDVDEHAEFEGAHPAREQHVGDIGQDGRRDPDQEHGAGKPLHQPLVGVAEAREQLRPGAAERPPRRQSGCVSGAGQRQNMPPR